MLVHETLVFVYWYPKPLSWYPSIRNPDPDALQAQAWTARSGEPLWAPQDWSPIEADTGDLPHKRLRAPQQVMSGVEHGPIIVRTPLIMYCEAQNLLQSRPGLYGAGYVAVQLSI